jgi:hypothetical protein
VTGVLIALIACEVAFLLRQEWRAWKRRAPRRALERATPTAIASLREGDLTKITGVIAPRAPMLMSAVGRQPCVGYNTAVEEMDKTAWRLIFNSAACASFFVTDESGTAVVEGNIVIAPHPDVGWGTPPASLVPRRDDVGSLPSLRITIERPTRYREILLKPGDSVSVLGRAKMEIDPAGRSSFRDPPMLNHITGSEDTPVVVAHDKIPFG